MRLLVVGVIFVAYNVWAFRHPLEDELADIVRRALEHETEPDYGAR